MNIPPNQGFKIMGIFYTMGFFHHGKQPFRYSILAPPSVRPKDVHIILALSTTQGILATDSMTKFVNPQEKVGKKCGKMLLLHKLNPILELLLCKRKAPTIFFFQCILMVRLSRNKCVPPLGLAHKHALVSRMPRSSSVTPPHGPYRKHLPILGMNKIPIQVVPMLLRGKLEFYLLVK